MSAEEDGGELAYHTLVAVPPPGTVDTKGLFQRSVRPAMGPLDSFVSNTNTLNKIYLPYSEAGEGDGSLSWVPELGNIILLGYMSAVESYVRAVITGLINVDDHSRRLVGDKQVSFALVTGGHDLRLLPEALLEHQTFSTEGKVEDALRNYVGISQLSPDVLLLDREYRKLCQVRHCCVHRFGKLGSQNAWKLGFDDHRGAIEHPFSPSRSDIEAIALILQAYVKALNNCLFRKVLERTLAAGTGDRRWTWEGEADLERFVSYYDLFAMKAFPPRSESVEVVYGSFRAVGMRARGTRAGGGT